MVGGSGEEKTILLAARHCNRFNAIAGLYALQGKVHVVQRQCEENRPQSGDAGNQHAYHSHY
ncbi:hypothetical protein ABFA25_09285 [Mycobacterium lepromatosis]